MVLGQPFFMSALVGFKECPGLSKFGCLEIVGRPMIVNSYADALLIDRLAFITICLVLAFLVLFAYTYRQDQTEEDLMFERGAAGAAGGKKNPKKGGKCSSTHGDGGDGGSKTLKTGRDGGSAGGSGPANNPSSSFFSSSFFLRRPLLMGDGKKP